MTIAVKTGKTAKTLKAVHYINQFYAGIGSEEKADCPPEKRDGSVGPGTALQDVLGDEVEISGTVICGDGYFNENLESASAAVLELIKSYEPDVVIAGPAFNAGRYGMACGSVAKLVEENLHVPVITGMFEENPGVDLFKRYAYVVPTGNSAVSMRVALPAMANIVKQVLEGKKITEPYMPKGIRKNYFAAQRGSARAVEMLLHKIKGEEFTTEYPMPIFDRVLPQSAVPDIRKARIALVSSGGPVPKGNPDHIESSSASKYGRYCLKDIDDFTPHNSQTAHGGYDPVYANEDLDRVLPLDVVKEMVTAGEIGSLHDYWYATVGNGTSVANAKRFAGEIAQQLKEDRVDAVILTST